MYIIILLYLCASMVEAVKYYGIMPAVKQYNTVQAHAMSASDNNIELESIFMTSDYNVHNGTDFLEDAGIFNTTFKEFFTQSSIKPSVDRFNARAAVDGGCSHGRIEDHLSQNKIKWICRGMAATAVGSVNTVSAIIDSKACNDASTGQPIPQCKTIVTFVSAAGQYISGSTVNEVCPDFMSLFVKCDGTGAYAQMNNGKGEASAVNTQKDKKCGGVSGPCTVINGQ